MKLNLKPVQVIRTQEELFRKELKGRTFTDEEWIELIVSNPKLLQRPIVEGRYKAVVAVPAEVIRGIGD
jgi:arsenate reductase